MAPYCPQDKQLTVDLEESPYAFWVRLHSFLAFSIKKQLLFLLPTAKLIMHLRCLLLLLPTAKLIMHLRWFKPDLILGGYGVETRIKVVSDCSLSGHWFYCL